MLGFGLALLKSATGGWIKYALIAVAIASVFFYVRNMGVQSERAKWERASLIEQARQETVNELWVKKSSKDADLIDEQVVHLGSLHEEARKGANNEVDIDTTGLSANGVMRLNSIR